jgi:hypothetical protein
LAQNSKSLILLEAIVNFIECGYVKRISNNEKDRVLEVKISKLSSIVQFIEKFKEYPLYGAKYLDFLDFCRGIAIIQNKEHLTEKGLMELKEINSGMNQRRKNFNN